MGSQGSPEDRGKPRIVTFFYYTDPAGASRIVTFWILLTSGLFRLARIRQFEHLPALELPVSWLASLPSSPSLPKSIRPAPSEYPSADLPERRRTPVTGLAGGSHSRRCRDHASPRRRLRLTACQKPASWLSEPRLGSWQSEECPARRRRDHAPPSTTLPVRSSSGQNTSLITLVLSLRARVMVATTFLTSSRARE